MHTKTWRSRLGLLLLAAAGVILAESAQAQQTGLLPLHPIKRKRVPCDQEDPIYRIYKDQYFGYHPTLWRRFPSGWGAPSPEAPDKAASFRELPLQPPNWAGEGDEPGEPNDEMAPAQPNPGRPNLPPAPPEDDRSPFEMDDKPGAAPRQETPPRQAPAPRVDPAPAPADDPNRSPFDPPGPRAGGPRSKPPELSSPAAPAVSRAGRSSEIDAAEAGSPLLAMPDTSVDPAAAMDPGHNHRHAAAAPSQPQQAPRRNRLAAMMDNLGWNVSRR